MEPQASEQGLLLDFDSTAAMLGVPVKTLYNWNYHGRLPKNVYLPALRRFNKAKLLWYIDHGSKTGKSSEIIKEDSCAATV